VTKSNKKLNELCGEIFGDKWIIPLANFLGITRQAVYLWTAEKRKIPRVVFIALEQKRQLDRIPDRWKKAVG
jgi:hypothetical protein